MAKADFDILFDNFKTILETYSAAEPTADQFVVCADRIRDLQTGNAIAYVIMHMGDVRPERQSSNGRIDLKVPYHFDMLVKAQGFKTGADYTEAAEAAGVRYRYLCNQLLNALFPQDNLDYSMVANSIGTRELEGIIALPPEALGEKGLSAGRLTLTVTTEWTPTARTGTDIEAISVTADKWSALLEP